jgi:uncharacterized protein YdhG (YjbR/CyaY superfamily)
MKPKGTAAGSIDEYISRFPAETQKVLRELRRVIRAAAPGAEEKISYQMPAFALHGILVYIAAYEHHIGFYPTSSGIRAFKRELSGYKSGKGSVQFPLAKPIPYELIRRIVEFRAGENARAKGELKKKG